MVCVHVGCVHGVCAWCVCVGCVHGVCGVCVCVGVGCVHGVGVCGGGVHGVWVCVGCVLGGVIVCCKDFIFSEKVYCLDHTTYSSPLADVPCC